MKKSNFYFDLPPELIAQTPIDNRDSSRLLCIDRQTGAIAHHKFTDLTNLLKAGDCLVLNDSRVMPARLLGRKDSGGAVEVVLLREIGEDAHSQETPTLSADKNRSGNERGDMRQSTSTWECLVRPGRKIRANSTLIFGDGDLSAIVLCETDGGNRVIQFKYEGIFLEMLERLGKMPLPPYIREELHDNERYQTVYSREVGSAAAPTAGLHFTHRLLSSLKEKGVKICYLTLHVGLGTFRPVKADDVKDHKMHEEIFVIGDETANTINSAKAAGGRVIAVGTTSCRVLETVCDSSGKLSAASGSTDIFIYPGFEFRCIDGLITNFHLPESTLIMLVSAFCGRENTLNAYNEAIKERYRFFSFGDACLIV